MTDNKSKRTARPTKPRIKLHVLGAAGDVTGSLNLFEYFDGSKVTRFILDIGLHQEDEGINQKNRLPKGITAKDVDFVIISHAHIDHCGWLPKFIHDGFTGPAYTHPATKDLMAFLLPDSGHLQEAAAERINRGIRRRAQKKGKRPTFEMTALYNEQEARESLKVVKPIEYGRVYTLADGIQCKFTDACHILGAAVVTLFIGKGADRKTICFTGNVGRPGTPMLRALEPVAEADLVITESTYGNRLHVKRNRREILAGIINRGYERAKVKDPKYGCGVIIIPAFAVGRVQTVLYDLRQLMAEGRIPNLQVVLDSPMAVAATKVHRKYRHLYNDETRAIFDRGQDPFKTPRYMETKDVQQSNVLDAKANEPIIIIGSSGMAAGGRILQHLERRLDNAKNTVVFVGYQGTGMLGHTLVNEKPSVVSIHKRTVNVRATIEYMSDYSGHADYQEIINWMRNFKRKPAKCLLVHGDTEALTAFKGHIESQLGWNVVIPSTRQVFEL